MQALALWIIFGLAQLTAAYQGIGHYWGSGWAFAALFAALFLRFPLIITIGSFLGAYGVWHWHWALAGLFAVPSLALLIPGVLVGLLGLVGFKKKPVQAASPYTNHNGEPPIDI